MEAMKQPTIRVVAVIAEGVPEADTKKLIAYARKHNKILLGPATVGGVQVDLMQFQLYQWLAACSPRTMTLSSWHSLHS